MRKTLLLVFYLQHNILRFRKWKLSYLVFLIMLILMVLMGCQKSNTEIQTFCDIPVYPNAALFENEQNRAVFLVESLSLSSFKEFYKNNLPIYGWKIIKDISNTITCEKNNQKVIIAYDFSKLPHNEFHVGVIDAGQPNNPPVFIRIIFSEN